MATDKKAVPTKEAKEPIAPGATGAPEIDTLRETVTALQLEIAKLKKDLLPQKVQVEGIFTGSTTPPPPSPPVQQVLSQYEALERALQNPVPDWVYPGSAPIVKVG